MNPPVIGSLFPNLRYVSYVYTEESIPFFQLPLPSLLALHVEFDSPHLFQNSLKSFPKFSPNIKRLSIAVCNLEATFIKMEPSYISRWRSLQCLVCSRVTLEVDDLVHLSSIPALTQLTFAVGATLPVHDAILVFPNLHDIVLRSESLQSISQLFSWIRLPAITDFAAIITNCPSKQVLSSLLTVIQTSTSARHTITTLSLEQSCPPPSAGNALRSRTLQLDLEDLRPCMGFSKLRCMSLDIGWNVGLTDNDLLTLASTWPLLQQLTINIEWGWNTRGGITPNGLLRLLETCRSLDHFALAVDTRGYTEIFRSPKSVGVALPATTFVRVLDSFIEEESVPAVSAFFASIMPYFSYWAAAWDCPGIVKTRGWRKYQCRWYRVSSHVIETASYSVNGWPVSTTFSGTRCHLNHFM